VQEAFEKALALAGALPDEDSVLPMLRGLDSFYQVRGPLSKAAAISARLVAAAERSGDACMLADAWRRQAWNQCCMGQMAEAEAGFARALAAFDPARHDEHVTVAGNDPRVLALANLCWLDLPRHGAARAARRADEAVAAAETCPHAVSACYGFVFAAVALQHAGRWEEALLLAERAGRTAEEKGIAYWIALSQAVIGRDQVHRGAAAAARATIARSLEGYRETQGELLRPFILSVLAEAHLGMGAQDAAEATLREAVEVARTLEAEGFIPALLLRLAQLMGTPDRRPGRRGLLRAALAAARAQGAGASALEAEAALRSGGRWPAPP
jgi:tetratricopeptide (TPR) repeat protein